MNTYTSNRSVDIHQFAMIPKYDVPRSSFLKQHSHKTTMDANYLVPVYVDEILPGDTMSFSMTAFARLATPIYPLMDNMYFETFSFFVPARILWTNWVKLQGEQTNPGDSISYTVPQIVSPAGGYAAFTVYDYMGLPLTGQVTGTITHNALPLRAYNKIWNAWFRDENLQPAVGEFTGDGPDVYSQYGLWLRGKKKDYFTGSLPWTQKGGVPVTIPLGTSAPIKTSASATVTGTQSALQILNTTGGAIATALQMGSSTTGTVQLNATAFAGGATSIYPSNLYADLTSATGATINQLRQAFQIQKLLERDARGGTRYTEMIRAHFGVINPDFRLQRPEYLGGGSTMVNVSPIAQTSATGLTGGTTPMGNLSAYGTMLSKNGGWTQSFTEHGYVLVLANIRGDISYQQGMQKMWSRQTRYDFYMPEFAMLGEQAVIQQEIFCQGQAQDSNIWGYQERWAEYRYKPSQISGAFRSTYTTPLDAWHLAEKYTTIPALNGTFIQANSPVTRVVAAPLTGQTFIADMFFNVKCTRPMPLYSVPGMIDHF